jgi:sugar-specific transcriptional regulator TrmB
MNKEDLTKIGLTKDQASVYMALLSGGTAPAGKISTKTGLKRGLVYKVLEQLLELNLIEKHEQEGKTTLFSPSHPSNLKKVIESNESEIQTAKNTFNTVSSELNSAFNLLSGKPNIQFFEGTKGMEEIMEDSLYAKGEILSYADAEAVEKHISNINKEYVKKRQKFGIKKRIIVPDSEFNRKFLKDYAKENVLKGTANGDISVTSNYIERGFIATEVDSFYEISHAIKIVRNDGKNNLFRTKAKNPNSSEKMSLERIQREVLTDENIQVFEREKMTDHDYSLLNQESRSSDSEKVWVLTRSIIDEETKKTFLVYERVSRDDLADYLQI